MERIQPNDWTNSANISWRPRNTSVNDNNRHDGFHSNHQTKTFLLGSNSTKKLSIKFLDPQTTEPKIDAKAQSTKYWKVLEKAIKTIFKHEALPVDYHMEFLYKCATKLVRYEKIDSIYDKLKKLFQEHIRTLNQGISEDDDDLYIKLNNVWNKFCIDIRFITNIFIVLDRQYLLRAGSTKGLWSMSTNLFRKYVVSDNITTALVQQILIQIQKDRNKSQSHVDKTLLKSLIQMLAELSLYDENFEIAYIIETEKVYEQESRKKVVNLGIHDYLDHISLRIEEEANRTKSYLQESTNNKVLTILIKHFLINNLKKILNGGMEDLIDNDYDQESHLRVEPM